MRRFMKCLAILMAAALCFGVSPCYAAEGAAVTGETAAALPGETIEFRVAIAKNPGLVSFNLRLRFDTSVFSLEYADEENPNSILCEQGDFSRAGTLFCAAADDGCNVLWTHTSNVSANGTLFVLRLRVSEDAQSGAYPIRIENIGRNTVNKNEEPVPVSCVAGKITVRDFSPVIRGEILTVKQGESFAYAVSIRDNPGIASCNVQVLFDRDVLSLDEKGYGDSCIEKVSGAFPGNLNYKAYSDGADVLWYSSEEVMDEGTLFVVHFKVSDSAALGLTPITILYKEENTMNASEEPVAFSVENGRVQIENSVDVTIRFTDAYSASVSVGDAKGKYVVAALYSADEKMTASRMEWDAAQKTITVRSSQNLTGGKCKVMVLDASFRPVCSAFCEER